jgi:hypothetical protein
VVTVTIALITAALVAFAFLEHATQARLEARDYRKHFED